MMYCRCRHRVFLHINKICNARYSEMPTEAKISSLMNQVSNNNAIAIKNETKQIKIGNKNILLKNRILVNALNFFDPERTRLKISGHLALENILDTVDYDAWRQELRLEDTFGSWYTVTILHVWLLLVRYMAEKDVPNLLQNDQKDIHYEDKSFIKNNVVTAMWEDVKERLRLLQKRSEIEDTLQQLDSIFKGTLIALDEGLEDDKVLAAAVWRQVYGRGDCDVENIEKVVSFIRRQLSELDNIHNIKDLEKVNWLSIEPEIEEV